MQQLIRDDALAGNNRVNNVLIYLMISAYALNMACRHEESDWRISTGEKKTCTRETH